MGNAVQVGIFKGSLEQFNIFLASIQSQGQIYLASRPLNSKEFYFEVMVKIDLALSPEELEQARKLMVE